MAKKQTINQVKKTHLTLPVAEIKVNEINPRRHNKINLDMIKKSMEQVGVVDDIIIDENNTILAGHGRFLALQDLGQTDIEVLRVEGLTEDQKKKYLVFSNRTTETSEWDSEILCSITDDLLKDSSFNVGDFQLEELVNAYKLDDICDAGEPSQVVIGNEPLRIFGFSFTKETQDVQDIMENVRLIQERNKDVEIFIGKEIFDKKGKVQENTMPDSEPTT